MPLPTTTSFSLFDWAPSGVPIDDAADGLLQYASSSHRSMSGPEVQSGQGYVQLTSQDGIPTDLFLGTSIAGNFTIEADLGFIPGKLTASLSNPAGCRTFVHVNDDRGDAVGLLLSAEGLAVVSQPDNAVIPFSQSATLIPRDGVHRVTVRLSVDAVQGTISIYLTPTELLAELGHVLRYVVQVPATASPFGLDRATLEVLGTAGNPSSLVLYSYRLAPNIVEPSRRPIADAGPDVVLPKEGLVRLDSSRSYDPDGAVLSYRWAVTGAPLDGIADVVLSGHVDATLQLTNNSLPPTDGMEIRALLPGRQGNQLSVAVVAPAAALQPLSLSLSGDELTISLQTDDLAAVATSFRQLVAAFTLPGEPGYSYEVSQLFSAALLEGMEGFDHVQTLALTPLAGGIDSVEPSPVFAPLLAGTYQFQLVVNDGALDSLPASVLVVVQDALQALDRIPDTDYIWGGLPDFWSLVPDKAVFGTFWSAAVQVVAGEVLKAWQTDYAKSLRDIQRYYMRKWMRYAPFLPSSGTIDGDTVVLEGEPATENVGTEGSPVYVLADTLVQEDDLLRFQVLLEGDIQQVHLPITGVSEDGTLSFVSDDLPEGTPTVLGVLRLQQLPVEETLQGVPKLKYPIATPTCTLTENSDFTIAAGVLSFAEDRFSVDELPPDELWGEINYYDNKQRIEDNFGRLAGLLQEDVEGTGLDYLSAVRALWYAYFAGPKVSSLRLGAQVFFGLPFAEETGVILSIDNHYTATHGRLLVQDVANQAVLRSYKYPLAVGLPVNPATGVPYVEQDTVLRYAPLSEGVSVDDYVKSPRWFVMHLEQGLITEVEKFFLFRVQVDANAVSGPMDFSLVARFIQQMKPAYTSPILSVLRTLGPDYIRVTDEVQPHVKLLLCDSPRQGVGDVVGLATAGGHALQDRGTPGSCRYDGYAGDGSWKNGAVDLALAMDRTSPWYKADLLLDGAMLQVRMSSFYAGGLFPYVMLRGTLQDDGFYLVGTILDLQQLTLYDVESGNPVTFQPGDTGEVCLFQGPLYGPGDEANGYFRYFNEMDRRPRFRNDGVTAPVEDVVNRRVRIDLDLPINGVPQGGPRFDQGLIYDDFLPMEPGMPTVAAGGLRRPNMSGTTPAGNGLFFWSDGGKPDGVQAFYSNYVVDAFGQLRPTGAAQATGVMLRQVGHKGMSLPPEHPDMLDDPEQA